MGALTVGRDTVQDVLDPLVEDIERIILGGGLEHMRERQQGGDPTLLGHSGKRLCARGGIPSQGLHPAGRQR